MRAAPSASRKNNFSNPRALSTKRFFQPSAQTWKTRRPAPNPRFSPPEPPAAPPACRHRRSGRRFPARRQPLFFAALLFFSRVLSGRILSQNTPPPARAFPSERPSFLDNGCTPHRLLCLTEFYLILPLISHFFQGLSGQRTIPLLPLPPRLSRQSPARRPLHGRFSRGGPRLWEARFQIQSALPLPQPVQPESVPFFLRGRYPFSAKYTPLRALRAPLPGTSAPLPFCGNPPACNPRKSDIPHRSDRFLPLISPSAAEPYPAAESRNGRGKTTARRYPGGRASET